MKLFIFAIGGTGSRVLKSLTMLLASGVKFKMENDEQIDKVVPIIIDADVSSGDLTRTVDQINRYRLIRDKLHFEQEGKKNEFFFTSIEKPIKLQLDNTREEKFRSFIGLDSMSGSNKALSSMLFSNDNLESTMEKGFLGNPNIGSVALNQFEESAAFKEFCSKFNSGDRIFIISSIFGGTGASGFPLLAKTLKNLSPDVANAEAIKKAYKGAISVLPYFKVKPSDVSRIDSSTFVSKTKAALYYYKRNLKEVDQLYFIADKNGTQYENNEGGNSQKNNAHFVEFVSALSIFDFVSMSTERLEENRDDGELKVREYGITIDGDQLTEIIFDNLSSDTKDLVMPQMTRYKLFQMYLKYRIEKSTDKTWQKDLGFDKNFYSGEFYKQLIKFNDDLALWYQEMENQDRRFVPFVLNDPSQDLFDFVRGVKSSKIYTTLNRNFDLYDEYLDSTNADKKNKVSKSDAKEDRFMELFYCATKKLVSKKLNIK